MKKLLLMLVFAIAAMAASAQYKVLPVATDTVQGAETVYFSPSYGYRLTGSTAYSGIVGFQFSKADIADSCSTIFLAGSYDNTNYVVLSGGNKALTVTTTDGNFLLYDDTPEYQYYKLGATCAAGDTVRFYNVLFIQKP